MSVGARQNVQHTVLALRSGLRRQDQELTCQDAIDAVHHQLCIVHAEAHRGFELDDVFPGTIGADADSVLLLQPDSKPEITSARGRKAV